MYSLQIRNDEYLVYAKFKPNESVKNIWPESNMEPIKKRKDFLK